MKFPMAGGVLAAALGTILGSAPLQAHPIELDLSGRVADQAAAGLEGVRVVAFIDGQARASAQSAPDGAYALRIPYEEAADQTLVVWWIPPPGIWVPEMVLLHESTRAQSLGLWSPCLTRLSVRSRMTLDVVLGGQAERLESLRGAGCLQAEV